MDSGWKESSRVNGAAIINGIAILTLWLAPLPAAFFVGRSVYWHLIHNWHADLGGWGLIPAFLAGGMVELVGLLSAHVALATARWNSKGHVRKEKNPWERAPVGLAATCFAIYCGSAFALAVVLEAYPTFATWAPALFTVMAATAYLSIGVYEQHRDRLAYYGLTWDWKSVPRAQDAQEDVRDAGRDDRDGGGTPKAQVLDRSGLDALDRAIMRTFRTEPDASYRTVAQAVGSAKTTVGGRVSRLERSGLMVRTAKGWSVQWSDNGKEAHD